MLIVSSQLYSQPSQTFYMDAEEAALDYIPRFITVSSEMG